MRRIAAVLLASLLVAAASLVPGSPATIRAASGPKVVIVVGPVESTTSYYRSDADAAAAAAAKYTDNVVKLYSPNATWSVVQAALQGASLVIYMGHGNGFPSPYFSGSALYPPAPFPQDRVDGLGLNATANAGDANTAYYGELSLRNSVRLAPGAVVLLHHLCYSAGQSESGMPDPSVTVAKARVDNMAAGWIAAGAQAVVAEPYSSPAWYVDQLFTANATVDAIWRARPYAPGNINGFAAARSPGLQAEMDTSSPLPADPSTVAHIYQRSLVTIPGARFLAPTYTPPSTPGTYVPVAPTRILDSRLGLGVPGVFSSGVPQTFQVSGLAGVPAGALAITGNLTVTAPTAGGYVALTPTATPFPSTSTLNLPAGDTRANGVTAPLGPGGTLAAVYITGRLGDRAQVILDVTGYYAAGTAGARYVPLPPARILDTRVPLGAQPLVGGTPATFAVAGQGGVPAGAVAVTGNVTIAGQSRAGYVALTPVPTPQPTTSTINVGLGDIRANGVTVPLGADGSLSATFVTGAAGDTTQLLFDVTGYYTTGATGASYVAIAPSRVLDTRIPLGSAALASATPASFAVGGQAGIPADAVGVTGNVTVVGQSRGGYVSLTVAPTPAPGTSTINFPLGDVRANGVSTPLSAGGPISATYVSGTAGDRTQLVFDVTGYFR